MLFNIIILLLLTIVGSIIFKMLIFIISKEKTKIFFSFSAWIGYFERIIIYTAIISNNLVAVSILISLKGVIRFPEILAKDKDISAEKFLFGTMFSITYTLVIYYISIHS